MASERGMTPGSQRYKHLAKRTEMVAVRLVPKLKYAAEIAARSQRRTVSSLIEVAVAAYLPTLTISEPAEEEDERPIKLTKLMESLWYPDESDRFVTLAENHRWLLEYEEEHRWQAIRERFAAKGPLTPAQRMELRGPLYDEIKKQVAETLRDRETAKFARG
jgi:hypothetical protein